MTDLVTWLRAQLDDDAAGADPHTFDCELSMTAGHGGPCTCGWSDRLDREVDAKRRILDLHEGDHECSVYDHHGDVDNCAWVIGGDCSTVKLLALPYADHPGYHEEWRP